MSPDEIWSYVTQSFIWAVLGFAGGVSVGTVVRQENPRYAVLRTLLGLLVLGIVAYQVYTDRHRTECTTENFRAAFAGLGERTDAAAIEREATKIRWRFIEQVLAQPVTAPPSLEQQNRDRARWLADLQEANRLIAEADAKRAASPSPYQGLRDCS